MTETQPAGRTRTSIQWSSSPRRDAEEGPCVVGPSRVIGNGFGGVIGCRDSKAKKARRRLWALSIAAGLLALLVAAAAWIWFSLLPAYRGKLQPGESYGIDVSSHQNNIDWSSVRRGGIDFAFIKATEGGDFVDDHFATNWAGSAAAGLKHGAYHFLTLCRPGADQADNFLRRDPSTQPQTLGSQPVPSTQLR